MPVLIYVVYKILI